MAKRGRQDSTEERGHLSSGGASKAPATKKAAKSTLKHHNIASKQPEAAARELQPSQIRHAGYSSTTSFAQLQLQELLSELCANDSSGTVHATVQELSHILLGLPSREASPTKIKSFASATGFETPAAKPLHFTAPTKVEVVGSHATGSTIRAANTVDVAVEMPASSFEHKDHLNHRYHGRRAMYLTVLAQQLAKHPMFADQHWGCFNHDARKPTLHITSSPDSAGAPVSLRLLPVCPAEAVQLRKLSPDANAVRGMLLPDAVSPGAVQQQADEPPPTAPTPLYNTSILQDVMLGRHTACIRAAVAALPRLPDALALLRSWVRQQGFADRSGAVTGFHMSMLSAHLHQRESLTTAMTAPQLVRAVLVALAEPSTLTRGLFMARGDAASYDLPPPPPASAFRAAFETVFVDASGWLNLMADVSKSALRLAQHAAQLTIKLLDSLNTSEDAFDAAFLVHHSPAAAFDYLVRVTLPSPGDAQLTTSDVPGWRQLDAEVERIATRALGTRAKLVHALRRPVVSARPAKGIAAVATDKVLIGVRVDPAAILRPLDMGPAAEDAAAAADFRAFWGDKAELRRFPDGSIAEAVVWEVPPGERHLLPDELLTYALRRHLPVGTAVQTFAAALDGPLDEAGVDASEHVAAARQLEAAADKLGKQLRGLSDLTLKIVSVQPMSAALRRTAPFPPVPHPLAFGGGSSAAATDGPVARCLDPVELLVHLEGSGRWPADQAAFLKTKAAMGCQLAAALASSYSISASASEQCIDVLADGFAFRLFLWSTRDEAMAQAAPAGGSTESGFLPPLLLEATLPQQAAHHGLVAAHATEAPAFAPTAALAARWAAAHMFSGGLAPEAVELLAAAAFVGPSSLPQPGSRTAGFLRFLALVASHPWALRPLVVDPASDMSPSDRQAAMLAFDAARQAGAAPGMWLVAPYSSGGRSVPWVRPSFGCASALRLAACARRSLEALQECMAGAASDAEPEEVGLTVFRTPLTAFDALLTLRPEALPQAGRSLLLDAAAAAPKSVSALSVEERELPPPKGARAVLQSIPADVVRSRGPKKLRRELLVGFDPVASSASLLQERFGHLAAFFYDGYGGRAIGVKWRIEAFAAAPLLLATAHTACPANNAAGLAANSLAKEKKSQTQQQRLMVKPNLVAALAQMRALGLGLVADLLLCEGTLRLEPELLTLRD